MEPTEKIWMNGELVDWDDAPVHVGAPGPHYGSGVCEGIRCYETPAGAAVFRLTDHLRRLETSARLLHMTLPYSVRALVAATRRLRRLHPELAVGHISRRRYARARHPGDLRLLARARRDRRTRLIRERDR